MAKYFELPYEMYLIFTKFVAKNLIIQSCSHYYRYGSRIDEQSGVNRRKLVLTVTLTRRMGLPDWGIVLGLWLACHQECLPLGIMVRCHLHLAVLSHHWEVIWQQQLLVDVSRLMDQEVLSWPILDHLNWDHLDLHL